METIHQTLNKLFKPSYHDNATSSDNYFTCKISTKPVPLNKKFKNMEASRCFHPCCTNCVAKYIETKVIHDSMSVIKCSNTNCFLMDALSYRSILPKKVFQKWYASKGGFVHGRCFCLKRKCSELILNECVETKSMVKRSECPNCKEVFCFSCMIRRKENHQCRQTGAIAIDIYMDKNDVLFMEMVKRKKWVRCLNYNLYIQRVLDGQSYCNIFQVLFISLYLYKVLMECIVTFNIEIMMSCIVVNKLP
ncbi:hypothetical protein MKX01_030768 [Papaver californicum]|nr:hypothetical protein MKX01_030768 [Papaver californicum]